MYVILTMVFTIYTPNDTLNGAICMQNTNYWIMVGFLLESSYMMACSELWCSYQTLLKKMLNISKTLEAPFCTLCKSVESSGRGMEDREVYYTRTNLQNQ